MLKRLLFFLLFILIAFTLTTSCSQKERDAATDSVSENGSELLEEDTDGKLGAFLEESSDAGEEYINSFIFLGESTTYHLKSRGVLKDGVETTQVWAPKSGTLMLTPTVSECRIVYPETNEELDLGEALTRKQPKFMLLTFGLNGAGTSISKGEEYFKRIYSRLIDTIAEHSPNTTVILQSCFPIGKNMDVSAFDVDVSTLNGYIDRLNEWTGELAEERGVAYLNSSAIFKGEDGFLCPELQVGDGYHLTAEAYRRMLAYMRTHACEADQ